MGAEPECCQNHGVLNERPRAEKPHKKLKVWAKALDLVAETYSLIKRFPADERFGLASQMRRAAVSVPSNIAEGAARHTRKEYVQFLYMARGSVSELDAQLEIALRLRYLSESDLLKFQAKSDELGRMLNALIRALSK